MTLELLAFVLYLNVLATISLWRDSARKPEKLKKKFLAALLHSKPITPKHQPPKSIGEGWGVSNEDRQFFEDFRDFARVVNWLLEEEEELLFGGPWRLQELPDTGLKLTFSDGPRYGRRYAIFHNQVRLGTLEVYASGLRNNAEEPVVYTVINIEWVRLLSFSTIRGFFVDIALHVTDPNPNTNSY